MNPYFISAFTFLFLSPANVCAGERHPMDAPEIMATFPSMTMVGNYGNGVKFTETYHQGGNISYLDDREADTGNWFEKDGMFCTFYVKGEGACFSVVQTGANCYEMYVRENEDGTKAEASNNWNSVGWDEKRPSTCDLSEKTV